MINSFLGDVFVVLSWPALIFENLIWLRVSQSNLISPRRVRVLFFQYSALKMLKAIRKQKEIIFKFNFTSKNKSNKWVWIHDKGFYLIREFSNIQRLLVLDTARGRMSENFCDSMSPQQVISSRRVRWNEKLPPTIYLVEELEGEC